MVPINRPLARTHVCICTHVRTQAIDGNHFGRCINMLKLHALLNVLRRIETNQTGPYSYGPYTYIVMAHIVMARIAVANIVMATSFSTPSAEFKPTRPVGHPCAWR